MRIALFTDTYLPDLNGVGISVSNIAKELRKKGHTVFIFAPKIKGDYVDNDKDLIRLPSIKVLKKVEPQIYSPLIWPDKNFRRIFKEDYDIIHAHGNGPYSGLGLVVSKIKHVPFVMTFHTIHTLYTHYLFGGKLIKPKQVEVFLRTFANLCNAVITPSDKMKNELIKYGFRKDVYVIPNFLDPQRFINLKKGYLRKLLNLPDEDILITTVGRIGLEKNIDFLLRVFKKIYEKNKNAHFVIVGQGPEKENLEKYAKDLGVSDRTHFTGKIIYDHMPQVYKDSDIFTFASYTETQGIVVLEASMAEIASVVDDDDAFKNMVIENKSGYVLPLDEGKFADKALYLLENKREREEMGKVARQIALRNFDPETLIDTLLNLYQKTISKK